MKKHVSFSDQVSIVAFPAWIKPRNVKSVSTFSECGIPTDIAEEIYTTDCAYILSCVLPTDEVIRPDQVLVTLLDSKREIRVFGPSIDHSYTLPNDADFSAVSVDYHTCSLTVTVRRY